MAVPMDIEPRELNLGPREIPYDEVNGRYYQPTTGKTIVVAHNSATGETEYLELEDNAFIQKCKDVGVDPMGVFFGPGYAGARMGTNIDLNDHTSWNLPTAQKAPNTLIYETYEHIYYILQMLSWYEELVPTRLISQAKSMMVYWTRTIFAPYMPRRGPTLSMPSLVSAKRISGEKALERMHGAVQIGHGFMLTTQGIRHFFQSLMHLAAGFAQSENFMKALAIATTGDEFKRLPSSRIRMKTIAKHMDDEVMQWGWLQHDAQNQLQLMNQWMNSQARINRGEEGDALVMSKETAALLTKAGKAGIDYDKSAMPGIQRLVGDISEKMTIYKLLCYVMNSFQFNDGNFVHPLGRTAQIGLYALMFDLSARRSNTARYTSDERTISMNVMPRGDMVDVPLDVAITHCELWNNDGTVKNPPSSQNNISGYSQEELCRHFMWKTKTNGRGQKVTSPQSYIGEMPIIDANGFAVFGTRSRHRVGESLWTSQATVANTGDAIHHSAMQMLQLLQESANADLSNQEVVDWLNNIKPTGNTVEKGGVLPIGPKDKPYAGTTMPPGLDTLEGLIELGRLATAGAAMKTTAEQSGLWDDPLKDFPILTQFRAQLAAAQQFATIWQQAIASIGNSLDNKCLVLAPGIRQKYAGLPYYQKAASLAFDTCVWNGGLRAFIHKRDGEIIAPAGPGGPRENVVQSATTEGLKQIMALDRRLYERVKDEEPGYLLPTMQERFRQVHDAEEEGAKTTARELFIAELEARQREEPLAGEALTTMAELFIVLLRDVAGIPLESESIPVSGPLTGTIVADDYVQTALRVSRKMIDSIILALSQAKSPKLVPASIMDPTRPMTVAELQQIINAGQLDVYFPPAESFMCNFLQSGLCHALEASRTSFQTAFDSMYENTGFKSAFDEQAKYSGVLIYNAMAQLINCTPMTRGVLLKMNASDVRVPLNFIPLRLHCLYGTHKVVKVKRREFAESARRKGVTSLQDDAEMHQHLITATLWSGWYATRPENVVDANNVHVIRYFGGEDVKPVNPREYHPHDDRYGDGSIIFIAVPYDWTDADVPENLIPQGVTQGLTAYFATSEDEMTRLNYPTAPYYNWLYRWRRDGIGAQDRMRGSDEAIISYNEPFPAACRQDCYMVYDENTRSNSKIVRGNGHWGLEKTYPGCGMDRLGGVFKPNPERGTFTIK